MVEIPVENGFFDEGIKVIWVEQSGEDVFDIFSFIKENYLHFIGFGDFHEKNVVKECLIKVFWQCQTGAK